MSEHSHEQRECVSGGGVACAVGSRGAASQPGLPEMEIGGAGAPDRLVEMMARSLSRRRTRHLLVTGAAGVGKSTLVREFARCVSAGEVPFLQGRQFVWSNGRDAAPRESRRGLAAFLEEARSREVGRESILCLDGLGQLLRPTDGATNKHLFHRMLNLEHVQIIGILTDREFDELLSGEAEILELCTRIEVPEPDEESALAIARDAARRLETEFGVRIEEKGVEKAVTLSAKFIWNQRLPLKAIRVLERACEDVVFDSRRETASEGRGGEGEVGRGGEDEMGDTGCATVSLLPSADVDAAGNDRPPYPSSHCLPLSLSPCLRSSSDGSLGTVRVEHVIRAVADITRVPVETLSGDIDDTDYEQILGAAVVGQQQAVEAVAMELSLIKAGITDPGKPASVMLFCGLNGVGKTELAKKLAEIYSATKRLQTFTMGNFVESHAVSGIIGVPAGYVGHDQGGRLINDLNADPYGVFLIDEIEKAHPDVLKPFLNLFDEGWIVDQRGVKAYADRAIFILTSNAGYEAISQMHQDKRPMEEIAEHVKKTLAMVRNERSSQPVLSTAFLSRIKRIVVFNPLSEEALLGIARLMVERLQSAWQKQRDKAVIIPEELIAHIARKGAQLNEKSGGREGGRGIRRLIDDLIESRIQRAAARAKRDYKTCRTIRLGLTAKESAEPEVSVTFE